MRTQVNFVKASDELLLPFDVYKILQISSVASRDSCSKALDHLLRNPPPGFSHQALYSRAALLQRSADLLLDATARRLYDQGLLQGDPNTSFSSSEVAGEAPHLQTASFFLRVQHKLNLSCGILLAVCGSRQTCPV